jgi:hydrogenase maturation protease
LSGPTRQPPPPAAAVQPSAPATVPWLVIGYGNTLRRDDGAGVRVAEAVERLGLPGVEVLTRHQLTPELAPVLATAHSAVFVDATVDDHHTGRWRVLRPALRPSALAHAADPRTLLALAKGLFGHAPRAWLITVPAPDMGYGEGLSPVAAAGVAAAVEEVCHRLTASKTK